MAKIIIRQAQPDDAADIYEIERLCFPDPWNLDAVEFELEENPRAFYVVAERRGTVVGYVGLWWIEDEGHITNVAVMPGFRNRKIAMGIIETLLEHTEKAGVRHYTLEVRRSNEAAIGLYEKFGFRVEGMRKNYYKLEEEDALIMWKHIDK